MELACDRSCAGIPICTIFFELQVDRAVGVRTIVSSTIDKSLQDKDAELVGGLKQPEGERDILLVVAKIRRQGLDQPQKVLSVFFALEGIDYIVCKSRYVVSSGASSQSKSKEQSESHVAEQIALKREQL